MRPYGSEVEENMAAGKTVEKEQSRPRLCSLAKREGKEQKDGKAAKKY